uniref:Ketimine reductase mu-crystallin n=1 Tax=Phallusia mammillata TaxID=59560 RepID=A0A6F9DA71_9ASCI|nr:ketimine reductase mu-crystallin-like [Phallusia mammillata]
MLRIPLITESQVKKFLTYRELIPAIKKALKDFSNGHVMQPLRQVTSVEKHQGYLLSMAAYNQQQDSLSLKVISLYPHNHKKNLPMHECKVFHFDASTGQLLAIIEAETLTHMRTAAASAAATEKLLQCLAPKNAKILAVLGAGDQARSHVYALMSIHQYEKIFVWNHTEEKGRKLVEELKPVFPGIEFCPNVEQAVSNADVITTVTASFQPVLLGKWLKEAVHINCVGACRPDWRELDDDCMNKCDVYVDSYIGATAESGDIILSKVKVRAEVGEVIAGKVTKGKNTRTLFKSLGMAAEDVAAASLVLQHYQNKQQDS